MVKILKDFRVTAAGIEKCPPYSITTGQPAPVANTAIETATVITVDVIRPVSSTLATALNRFIFYGQPFRNFSFIKAYPSNSVNFFKGNICAFFGVAEFRSR